MRIKHLSSDIIYVIISYHLRSCHITWYHIISCTHDIIKISPCHKHLHLQYVFPSPLWFPTSSVMGCSSRGQAPLEMRYKFSGNWAGTTVTPLGSKYRWFDKELNHPFNDEDLFFLFVYVRYMYSILCILYISISSSHRNMTTLAIESNQHLLFESAETSSSRPQKIATPWVIPKVIEVSHL